MTLSRATQLRIGVILFFTGAVIYISFMTFENGMTTFRGVFIFGDQRNESSEQLNDRNNNTTTIIPTASYVYLNYSHNSPFPGVENYTLYTVARAKLKPLVSAKPLRPEFGQVINDVTYFKYPIEIQPCRKPGGLFVAIISATNHFENRQVIRQTWFRYMFLQSDLGKLNLKGFGFVLGMTQNKDTQKRIEEESAKYNDILQIDMMDHYYNLTLKVVGLTNWLNNHCSQVDFVLKVDDDVYVNILNMLTVLAALNTTEQSVYGFVADGTPQRGGNKWKISYEDWPWRQYPRYLRGAAVLMPGKTIFPLLAAAQTTPYLPFDDTFLTGLCTSKAGIKVRHSANFFVGGVLNIPDACTVFHSATWLIKSVQHLNKSHKATEDFYGGVTHCVVVGSDGINRTVVPNETAKFSFSAR